MLTLVKLESFRDKILLLGAWHESRGGGTPWRSAHIPRGEEQAQAVVFETFDRVVIEVRAAVATLGQTERAEFLRDLAGAMVLILGKTFSALAKLPIERATTFD